MKNEEGQISIVFTLTFKRLRIFTYLALIAYNFMEIQLFL